MSENKLGVEMYLESVETLLIIDTEIIDEDLVMFGFEEHVFEEGGKRVFKTEQVLDVEDLTLIKHLIDKTIARLRSGTS